MLQLPAIFSDHMVLQRGKNIAVWGKTDRAVVTVSLEGQIVEAVIEDGNFEALLPPLGAGGPYQLTITAADGSGASAGGTEKPVEEMVFQDVMMGEVWLAGGQSNMELELQNSKDGAEVVKNVQNDRLRYYYTPKIPCVGDALYEAEAESAWELCLPETAGRWSAVGYYFAKKLAEDLNVTVGIIGCNWGGTSASCWVGRETLENDRVISNYIEDYDRIVAEQDPEEHIRAREAYVVYQKAFEKRVEHYYATAENPTWEGALEQCGENQYPGPMGPRSEFRPCGLYETMIQRITPYTLAGFLYYQGEEDDHRPYTYYELLSGLIRQWRKDWRDETLPFLLVQLPMFQSEGEPDYQNWPFVREAQMRVFQTVKNTGIAVILDQGEFANIHPVRKDLVGERLEDQALCQVYGKKEDSEVFGPIYRSYRICQNQMILSFDYANQGIHSTADQITGFEIAGPDRKYYPADAQIQGEEIVISSPEVSQPMYARYCWTNYREVTLFGANQMPVAPFRTSRSDGAVATGSRNGWEFAEES